MRTCRLLSILSFVLLFAFGASAQIVPASDALAGAPAVAGACGSAVASAGGPAVVADAPLYFYSLPADRFTDGENRVETRVLVDGELYLEERFQLLGGKLEAIEERRAERMRESLGDGPEALTEGSATRSERAVFELLAERGELRAQLRGIAADGAHWVEVETLINGESLGRTPWSEFVAASERAVAEHGLPVAVSSFSQPFSTHANPGPQEFQVCGDGTCAGGSWPNGEDCETCPEDCGGGGGCSICGNNYCGPNESCSSCAADCGSCPSCPEDLGTEERTEYLGSQAQGTYCMNGWPGKAYYTSMKNNYKTYDVQRTRECDGSITETVVPGSTTYWSAYCWDYLGYSCYYSYGYASPICAF